MGDNSLLRMSESVTVDHEMGDLDSWFDGFVDQPVWEAVERYASNGVTERDAWEQPWDSDLAGMMMSLEGKESHYSAGPSTGRDKEYGGQGDLILCKGDNRVDELPQGDLHIARLDIGPISLDSRQVCEICGSYIQYLKDNKCYNPTCPSTLLQSISDNTRPDVDHRDPSSGPALPSLAPSSRTPLAESPVLLTKGVESPSIRDPAEPSLVPVPTSTNDELLLLPASSGPLEGMQSGARSKKEVSLTSSKATNGTRQRISCRNWEEKRTLIESLYQQMSLSDTRNIMAKAHNFHASEKAYKDKLREWKLHKNMKQASAMWMLQKAKNRELEEGKKTIFRLRGVEVPPAKLERFSKVSNVAANLHTRERFNIGPTPTGISYCTPNLIKMRHLTSLQEVDQLPVVQNGPLTSSTSQENTGKGLALPGHSHASSTRNAEAISLLQVLRCWDFSEETVLFRHLLCSVLDQKQKTRGRHDAYREAFRIRDHLKIFGSEGEIIHWTSIQTSIAENFGEAKNMLARFISNAVSQSNAKDFTVPLSLFALASCGAAHGQNAEVEVTLDCLLIMLPVVHCVDRKEAFFLRDLATRLLIRTYLVQCKFWSLEGVMIPFIAQVGASYGSNSEHVTRLEMVLLLAHTDGFSIDKSGETLALNLLGRIEPLAGHMQTTLLLLELLRCRYEKMCEFMEMIAILARVDRVLKDAPAKNLPSDLSAYITLTLAWSYTKWGRYSEAGYWLDQFTPADGFEFGRWDLHSRVSSFLLRKQGNLKDSAPFLGEENLNGTSLVDTLTTRHPMFAEMVKCLEDDMFVH